MPEVKPSRRPIPDIYYRQGLLDTRRRDQSLGNSTVASNTRKQFSTCSPFAYNFSHYGRRHPDLYLAANNLVWQAPLRAHVKAGFPVVSQALGDPQSQSMVRGNFVPD